MLVLIYMFYFFSFFEWLYLSVINGQCLIYWRVEGFNLPLMKDNPTIGGHEIAVCLRQPPLLVVVILVHAVFLEMTRTAIVNCVSWILLAALV